MSITAYVGLPRSGKSYSVVEHQILPAVKAGRHVVTNIPLVEDEWEKLNLSGKITTFHTNEIELAPEKILEYAVNGCIFVLDEAWRLWPQGKKACDIPEVYMSLLAEHGHRVDAAGNAMQIVLVVQDLANLAAFARRLVELTYVTTKLSFVGLAKSFRVDVFHGSVTGCTPNPKKALRQLNGRYRKEVYSLYKSHTMSEAKGLGANETNIDSRANIFKRPVFIIGAIAVPLVMWFSFSQFSKAFHHATTLPGVPASSTGDGSRPRSGAEPARPVAQVRMSADHEADQTRVLMEVEVGAMGYVAYLTNGVRVFELGSDQCRRLGKHLQCLYRGAYYDGVGFVELAPSRPVDPQVAFRGRGSRGPG